MAYAVAADLNKGSGEKFWQTLRHIDGTAGVIRFYDGSAVQKDSS